MADVVEGYKFTKKDELPGELTGLEGFGVDNEERFYIFPESGEPKQLRHVKEIGRFVMAMAETKPDIEEMELQAETPDEKIARLEERVAELEAERDKNATPEGITPDIQAMIEQAVADSTEGLKSQLTDLQEAHKREIEELERKNRVLEEEKNRLIAQLEGRDKPIDREETDYVASDEVSVAETTPPSPLAADRVRYNPRSTLLRKLRNRTPWAAPTRDYYIDNQGPYYLDENERPVYVSEEEVVGPAVGGWLLAAAGVYIGWELLERYGLGWEGGTGDIKKVVHNQAIEIGGLHKANHHLNEVLQNQKTLLHDQATEIADLNKIDQHLTNTNKHLARIISHDHHQEMGAIHRLQVQELKERLTSHPMYFGFRYPWDWAASKVGQVRANGLLYTLSGRAAEHGHHIQWLGSGRHRMLKVDGTFNTRHVVGVLTRYLGR